MTKLSLKLATLILLAASMFSTLSLRPEQTGQTAGPQIYILDQNGAAVNRLTDGDTVRLQLELGSKMSQAATAAFSLDTPGLKIGECQVEAGSDRCESAPVITLGWGWDPGGQARHSRKIIVSVDGDTLPVTAEVQVSPRPVVMVHGFASDWTAWKNYLGPQGYLASIGVAGYAVGDGQFPQTLNTGSLGAPTGRTNTIAQNAELLSQYIAQVKKATGAQQVDLVAHSMGGLITRYYIDRVMKGRDVAQLLMLGSPMAGTDCADLPASLGFYLPAALEIRPGYVREIFNSQITHRRGVPFYALAGTPIQEAFKSPCTDVPTDLAVSEESVTAIQLHRSELPIVHMELNTSEKVFSDFVKPHLQTPAGASFEEADPPLPSAQSAPLQFTRLYSGHLPPAGSQDLTIQIDAGVSVASFALYDYTHTLSVTVRGASGNVIALDAAKNGLVIVDNPEMLFYLGYGFENPKPGAWHVTLQSSNQTPAGGADYALTACFKGGATLNAQASTLIPQSGQAVQLTAGLDLAGQPLALNQAQVLVRDPHGGQQRIDLQGNEQRTASWTPAVPGLYGLDFYVAGHAPDGSTVERSAFLAVEAQPDENLGRNRLILAGAGLAAVILAASLLFVGRSWWSRREL